MPLVSALFMSVMLFVAFTGSQQVDWRLRHIERRSPITDIRSFVPPARKSVIVSPDGQAQPIAAPTHPVRRDRSRIVYRSAAYEPAETPRLNVVRNDFQGTVPVNAATEASLIEAPPVAPAPVAVAAIPPPASAAPVAARTEAPASPASKAPVSVSGTLVRETGLIDTDDSYLTEDDRITTNRIRQAILADNAFYVVSMHVRIKTVNGVVTLIGEVSTRKEKQIIGEKAANVAGAGNVSNELAVLVG